MLDSGGDETQRLELGLGSRHEDERVGRVVVPRVQHIADVFVPSERTLDADGNKALDQQRRVEVDGLGKAVCGGSEQVVDCSRRSEGKGEGRFAALDQDALERSSDMCMGKNETAHPVAGIDCRYRCICYRRNRRLFWLTLSSRGRIIIDGGTFPPEQPEATTGSAVVVVMKFGLGNILELGLEGDLTRSLGGTTRVWRGTELW